MSRKIDSKGLDVLVVGGGQAGLAMAHETTRRGLDTLVLEASPVVGSAWRSRWDSLRLFTPAGYSALPGLPFPGDPERYPTRDEVVTYLETYVRALSIPLALDEPVRDVRRCGSGFAVTTDYRRYRARHVVVATGPFQQAHVPAFAAMLPRSVRQLHSSAYRRPDDLPNGPVLVVGGGNTGVQIAAELSATRPTALAVGSRLRRLPTRVFGRNLFDWLERSGAMRVSVETRMGRRMSAKELLIGESPRSIARDLGVRLLPRAVGVAGSGVVTEDGAVTSACTVIWATGYRSEYPWLREDVVSPAGRVTHRRGATHVPGLHFLGLSWLHTRGSALLGWVGDDAAYLADHIERAGRTPTAERDDARRTRAEELRSTRGAVRREIQASTYLR